MKAFFTFVGLVASALFCLYMGIVPLWSVFTAHPSLAGDIELELFFVGFGTIMTASSYAPIACFVNCLDKMHWDLWDS